MLFDSPKKWTLPLGIVLILIGVAGCSFSREADIELLKRDDPEFRQMIQRQAELRRQIAGLKDQMHAKHRAVEAEINKLRLGYDAEAEAARKGIDDARKSVDVIRKSYAQALDGLRVELEAKKAEQEELEDALESAREVLDRKDAMGMGEMDVANWQARISQIEGKLNPLSERILQLEDEITIRKRKLKFL